MNALRSGAMWLILRFFLWINEEIYVASKRKKRRQAARKEAQRKLKQMADTNNTQQSTEQSKKYREYRVASQLDGKSAVFVITVKEWDEAALLAFICRIYEVPSVDKFSFLEVHEVVEGGVRVIRDGGTWPVGATVVKKDGFVVRGKDRALEVRSTGSKVIANIKPAAQASTATTATGPTEQKISFKRYKTKYMAVNG